MSGPVFWRPAAPPAGTVARFDGRGHPALRVTHDKTWEITPDARVGAGATCVVAVDAVTTAPAHGLAGALRLTIVSRSESVDVDARANPLWRPGGPAVVRRSSVRRAGTLATDADLTAADLPRALAAAVADPQRGVAVVVQRRAAPAVVLLRAPGAGADRLRAELEAADVVVTEDADAHRLVDTGMFQRSGEPTDGERVLVVATAGLPGGSVPHLIGGHAPLEVAGLPPELAVAAGSPRRAPVLLAVDAAPRTVPPDVQLIVTGHRDPRRVTASWSGDGPWIGWGPVVDIPTARGRQLVCLDGVDGGPDVDPALLAMARTLRVDGIPTKAVAAALAAAAGISRSRAYDIVAAMSRPD